MNSSLSTPRPRPGAWAALGRALAAVWASPARRLLVAALALAGAGWLIQRQLRDFSWSLFVVAVRQTPIWAICAAILLTPASYVCLAITEWFSLHSLGHPVSFRRACKVAFVSYAVSNSLGFSLATGGATRLRLYAPAGLGVGPVTAVALVAGTAVSLSGVVTAGLGLLVAPAPFAAAFHQPIGAVALAGLLLLTPSLLWFTTLRAPRARTQRIARAHLGRVLALGAGVADWVLSGAALYVLLPHPSLSGLPVFLAVFVLGSLVSAATGVPGGIGVFEAVVLGLSMLLAKAHETATALILYRVIYSLGPLCLMAVILGGGRLSRGIARPAPRP